MILSAASGHMLLHSLPTSSISLLSTQHKKHGEVSDNWGKSKTKSVLGFPTASKIDSA